MTKHIFQASAVICAAILFSGPVAAQDKSTSEILSEAQGFLHLTCNSLSSANSDDEDAMLDVIGLMIAVSLDNRGIDFTSLDLTPQETAEIQAEFADQIGDICAEDANALMAGIVDHTVADLVTYY